MIDDIAVARVRKEDDNAKVKPVDLLQTVIADIQEGEMEADGLFIITINRDDEEWKFEQYRCGLSRTEEVAFLELAKDIVIRRWISDD